MDTPQTNSTIVVDVVSDVACPWCYLGERRLRRAAGLVPGVELVVHWRPFQLDPTIPPEGMDRRLYMERKFGSLDRVAPIHDRLAAMGKAEGIDYRFDDMTRSANTIDAHRVIRWADGPLQGAMVDRLFKANFTDCLDIGDPAVLARLAGEVGLDEADIASRLATDLDRDSVRAEIDEAARMGIDGVPCFIIDGRYAVMGAQEAETLARAIRTAAQENAGSVAAQ
jgi:predicted DsbA family dithiol-disulfide isomerase